MSISPIMKGNTPLMNFSFATDGNAVIILPTDITKITVRLHDSAGVRNGTGSLSNLNALAGTVQYLMSSSDTANPGVLTMWVEVLLLGETAHRDFDPQRILIEDPSSL